MHKKIRQWALYITSRDRAKYIKEGVRNTLNNSLIFVQVISASFLVFM